jgi:hypothetical protein
MASPLGTIYSRADALKRQLYDMLTNPRDAAAMLGGRIVESGQQAQALQEQAFADPNRPFRVTDPQAMARLTDMLMAGPMGFAPAGITAYHGSPYLFRQFDPTKVGTGEGAQAYGVGAGYTAESRPVAEYYQQQLAINKARNNLDVDPRVRSGISLMQTPGSGGIENLENMLQSAYGYKPKVAKETVEKLKKTIGGYLYKGDIPDEILPKFLDWDKPLSQQSEEVRNALKRRITNVVPQDKFDMGGNARLRDNRDGKIDPTSSSPWLMETTDESGTKFFGLSQKDVDRMFGAKDAKDLTGEQVYARLTQDKGSQQAASDYLNSIGVRGIRYLDQGSRGTSGQGTSNFIPFSPEDFKVQEINDIPVEDWISKGLL